jgi:hypothetical protein
MKESRQTLQRTMHQNRLKGCQPRKTPLQTEKHVNASLKIAKTTVNQPHFSSRFCGEMKLKKIILAYGCSLRLEKKSEAPNP